MAYFSKLGIDESSNLCITSSDAEWGYPLTKANNVLNDWKYNEEIIKSIAKYKIRHHHRII